MNVRGASLCLLLLGACGGTEPEPTELPPDLAPALVPSGCPAPPSVKTADLGAHFLSPEDVLYLRTIDGDTAHFLFKAGEKTVRFLWVNTEEKAGADVTDFGIATVPIVEGWIAAAKLATVAVEADPKNPTQPHLDTYGRTLGLVFLDGELAQTRIVREGLSAYYTQFGCAPSPVHEALLYAEAEARANQRGIWAPGHPTDYEAVFDRWIRSSCRPDPYLEPYCK